MIELVSWLSLASCICAQWWLPALRECGINRNEASEANRPERSGHHVLDPGGGWFPQSCVSIARHRAFWRHRSGLGPLGQG